MIKNILSLGVLAILLLVSFLIGANSVSPIITTRTIKDTIVVEKPVPHETVKIRTEYVYVPIKNINTDEEENEYKTDSILIPATIERRIYQDSLYRAVISGAVVGNVRPTLESIELYVHNKIQVVSPKRPLFRPYFRGSVGKQTIGIGVGAEIKDKISLDIQYVQIGNRSAVVLGANYKFNI